MTNHDQKISSFSFQRYKNEFILATVFLLTFTPTLFGLWERWFVRDSYYSHGILVPFVTIYLIWQKKEDLLKIKPGSCSWGIPLIIGGIFVHILSSIFRIAFTSGFAMIFVLFGLILHFYGRARTKELLFPLCFLFFMIPLPLVIIVNISFKLKLFAASIATQILNSMGFIAEQSGSIIRMKNSSVTVDDVCSGLRSLITLTALGSIFAYWLDAPMYKKILLFLTTIPIAIITNVCRIIFLSSVSEIWGPEYTIGLIHDIAGFSVFALAFVMLYTMGKVIE